jgi:hypothetical protein
VAIVKTTFRTPPPVKVRMARGVRNNSITVDLFCFGGCVSGIKYGRGDLYIFNLVL